MQKLNLTKRRVITLCGSTKFRDEFHKANAMLTMQGDIVLSVGFFMHAEGQHTPDCKVHEIPPHIMRNACTCNRTGITAAQKEDLDMLHFCKIQMSSAIYVVNVGGYVGQSTHREIAFAIARGKEIEWLDKAAGDELMTHRSHELGHQVAAFAQGYVPELM